jgi:plasmid stabilization system protein ParE
MAHEETVYKVIVAPAANDRMYDHFEFLARVSEAAANKLLDTLVNDIRSLERMPYRNPVYDRPYLQRGKYRYMMSGDRYRVVYQIEADTVFVDDIQDCRQSDDSSFLADVHQKLTAAETQIAEGGVIDAGESLKRIRENLI